MAQGAARHDRSAPAPRWRTVLRSRSRRPVFRRSNKTGVVGASTPSTAVRAVAGDAQAATAAFPVRRSRRRRHGRSSPRPRLPFRRRRWQRTSSIALRLVLGPQFGEDFAFDLAAKQRADARAGEAEAKLVDEIRRQHESIAERMADRHRIDVGACRAPGGCRAVRSNRQTPRAWKHVSWHHLFRRETVPACVCPRSGHPRRLFAATLAGGAGRVPRPAISGSAALRTPVSVKIAAGNGRNATRARLA